MNKRHDRKELESFIDEKLDTALGQYYTDLEHKNNCEYSGDITPEQSLRWDNLVSQIADLFEELANQNKI